MNRYMAFSVKERGYSHIASGLPRQDNARPKKGEEQPESYCAAAIADGHGSARYIRSDRGSQIAVDVFFDIMKDLFSNNRSVHKNAENIKINVKSYWDSRVLADAETEPFTAEELTRIEAEIEKSDSEKDKERLRKYLEAYRAGKAVLKAYGTTLIGICACDECVFALQIGDGTCVAFYEDGSCDMPVPDDPKNAANVTNSLCSIEANDVRLHIFEKYPVAVFAASDGLDDSYGQGEQLFNFYRSLCIDLNEQGMEYTEKLQEQLADISKNGSKDDMSIAGIYDSKALRKAAPLIAKRLEAGRKRFRIAEIGENGKVSDYTIRAQRSQADKVRKQLDLLNEELQSCKRKKARLEKRLAMTNEIRKGIEALSERETEITENIKNTMQAVETNETAYIKYVEQNKNADLEIEKLQLEIDEINREIDLHIAAENTTNSSDEKPDSPSEEQPLDTATSIWEDDESDSDTTGPLDTADTQENSSETDTKDIQTEDATAESALSDTDGQTDSNPVVSADVPATADETAQADTSGNESVPSAEQTSSDSSGAAQGMPKDGKKSVLAKLFGLFGNDNKQK